MVELLQKYLREEADPEVLSLGSNVWSVEQPLHLGHHDPLHGGVSLQQLGEQVHGLGRNTPGGIAELVDQAL